MRGLLVFVLFMALTVGAVWYGISRTPPQHLPWTPLSVDQPVGMATNMKLRRLKDAPERCFAVLETAGIEYTRLPDGEADDPCAFRNALTLDRSAVPYSASLQLTCPLTVALAIWERQAALPLAEEMLGSPLVRIDSFGSYSCRRLYGRSEGRYSQHATANAIDIAAFRFADGRAVSVARGYGEDTQGGEYLDAVRASACDIFSIVLGPDYNDAHNDHFHLDMSGGGLCR